jgi:pimeloyl-ACP methyl ester carboxylesterase
VPLTATQPELYFEDRGAGDPLLVITGFAVSCAVLEPLVDLCGTRLRCITYDHPGSGRSSKRAFPFSTARLAASAVRVLDALGIEAAHVAGLSMGGIVAQELALRFPHRVRGLILMGTSTSGALSAPADPRKVATVTASIVRGSLQRRRLWLGPAVFSPGFLNREPDRADALLESVTSHPAAPWGIAGQLCATGFHDRTLDLHRIRTPTLVLHGERDILVPLSNARRLAEGIPDADLHIFAGVGHAFEYERLDETFSVICDWLDRRRPVAGERLSARSARAERLTRPLAAPAGALRLGRSSIVLGRRALASAGRHAQRAV